MCLDCGNWSALRLQPAGGFKLLIVCAAMQILLLCFVLLINTCRRLCSLDGMRHFRVFCGLQDRTCFYLKLDIAVTGTWYEPVTCTDVNACCFAETRSANILFWRPGWFFSTVGPHIYTYAFIYSNIFSIHFKRSVLHKSTSQNSSVRNDQNLKSPAQ